MYYIVKKDININTKKKTTTKNKIEKVLDAFNDFTLFINEHKEKIK